MSLTMAVALAFVMADSQSLQRIELEDGHLVQGEILKERADSLIVDVGGTVMTIPKRSVVRRASASEPGPSVAETMTRQASYGQSDSLYATADLRPASIKELVDRFGEAVVLVKTPSGLGSGFIIDDIGHCITNCHVVEKETRITVDIYQKSGNAIVEKTIGDVEIVALSPFLDLALLKIPSRSDVKFTKVFFGSVDDIRQGDMTFAVGNPEGLTRSVTQGIISNKNRNVSGLLFLQTTTQINPGNSGGPLFNNRGQVIGVTNMKRILSEGLGFAIPINYVKDFLENREAFAFNKDNPNTGYHYFNPPRRVQPLKKPGK